MKKFLYLLLIAALFFVFTGCSSQSSPDPEELEKVTVVLDWVPNTNHTGLYVAQEKGYFAEAGLEVEIIQPTAGGSAQLIAAGQGEFGISYQEEVNYSRAEGLPVVAIAAIIQHNTSGFAAPIDKGINSPADFIGKRYGGWGSEIETAMLKALVEPLGGSIADIEVVNIGTADFFSSVERDVDFAWIYYGWTGIEAELKGIDLYFEYLQDINPALDFYTPVIIAHEDLIRDNPELIRSFLAATTKGYQFAIENPAEAAEILLAKVPELDEELVFASQEFLAGKYRDDAPRWGEMKAETWENYMQWMAENGLIAEELDIARAYTNEFLPE